MPESIYDQVAEILRQNGINASTVDYDGITVVNVAKGGDTPDEAFASFGNAGDTWDAEWDDTISCPSPALHSIEARETNPRQIAYGIMDALSFRVRGYGFAKS